MVIAWSTSRRRTPIPKATRPIICVDTYKSHTINDEIYSKTCIGNFAERVVHTVFKTVQALYAFWARWPSGRASDSGARVPGFEPHGRRCVVSLSCVVSCVDT